MRATYHEISRLKMGVKLAWMNKNMMVTRIIQSHPQIESMTVKILSKIENAR